MRRISAALMIALAVAALFVACGGGGATTPTTPTPTPTVSTVSVSAPSTSAKPGDTAQFTAIGDTLEWNDPNGHESSHVAVLEHSGRDRVGDGAGDGWRGGGDRYPGNLSVSYRQGARDSHRADASSWPCAEPDA